MSGQENTWILFFIKRTKLFKNGEVDMQQKVGRQVKLCSHFLINV